ncbi:MAG: tetratricopeptide repeat protein [Betaproteobacteria bacterium]
MRRIATLLFMLFCASAATAQLSPYANRAQALNGARAEDSAQRAEALTWIALHGRPSDEKVLRQRLTDDSALVRRAAEQGLWVLWSRSGDDGVDALLARGVEEMQTGRLDESIATFTEVIRRKPGFAEGWNKRATALFLAGAFRKSLVDCDQVMKRNPYHFGALAGYGQIYFQLEQYETAIKYFRRALRVNPNMTTLEMNIKAAEREIAGSPRQST